MEIPLSLQTQESRMKHTSKNNEEKRRLERRRNLLYLILDYLRQEGLSETSEMLGKEAQLSADICVCDNIDLETILTHYTDYYLTKFNKLPKICKKINNTVTWSNSDSSMNKKEKLTKILKKTEENKQQKRTTLSPDNNEIFQLDVTKITNNTIKLQSTNGYDDIYISEKVLRPINDLYPVGTELRDIAEMITKEIVLNNLNVHWSEIHGLDDCKKIVKEAIIYPAKYPEFFKGKFGSWQGILLYGPPGTGKTMLARAAATECKWTFFNITASSLISKWRGESEKYVRVLCDLAIYQAPTIIFIDEIDWTTSGDDESGGKTSEPARRFRAELLARLDGLITMEKSRVVILAATNAPWNLDAALLRRLDKHILVDLPNESVRRKILKDYTTIAIHKDKEFNNIVAKTQYYSGSDLRHVCKEAWMSQVRKYIAAQEEEKNMKNNPKPLELIDSISALQEALNVVLPTTKHLAYKYEEWKNRMNTYY